MMSTADLRALAKSYGFTDDKAVLLERAAQQASNALGLRVTEGVLRAIATVADREGLL